MPCVSSFSKAKYDAYQYVLRQDVRSINWQKHEVYGGTFRQWKGTDWHRWHISQEETASPGRYREVCTRRWYDISGSITMTSNLWFNTMRLKNYIPMTIGSKPALDQRMAWLRASDNPLFGLIMSKFKDLYHISMHRSTSMSQNF